LIQIKANRDGTATLAVRGAVREMKDDQPGEYPDNQPADEHGDETICRGRGHS
jgi:hypothetical protein